MTLTPVTPDGDKPLGLRERNRQERLARILSAAEQLFAEKGFDQVTTREIAQAALVGEATLFRYVSNKSDLLLLVIGSKQDLLLDELELADDRTAAQAPPSPSAQWFLDRITTIYRARIHYYVADPVNVAQYVSAGLQSGSMLGPKSTFAGDRVIARVHKILEAGQQSGALRDDVDPLLVARNINGTYIHEVLRSPARNLTISATWDRLAERLDVMLRPLITAAGAS